MENERQRVLVIDRQLESICNSFEIFGPNARNIYPTTSKDIYSYLHNEEGIMRKISESASKGIQVSFKIGGKDLIEKALYEEPYKAILVGYFGPYLSNDNFDGAVIAERLREGVYGPINQNTKILFLSSSWCFPKGYERFRLSFCGDEMVQEARVKAQRLLEE